jgi:hypothetical protein
MRYFMILAAILLAAPAIRAAEGNCGCFTPGIEEIIDLESRITDLPAPVYQYARYYSGWSVTQIVNGKTVIRKFVQGQYLPVQGETSGIHIVEGRRLRPPKTEGCIANYDIPLLSDAFEIYARCNHPGGWIPSAEEIVELEGRLTLPKGAEALADYARHYAGVTEDGRRLVLGVLLSGGEAPGITVESELEVPLANGSGCAAISVRYNPATKLSSVRCNETR